MQWKIDLVFILGFYSAIYTSGKRVLTRPNALTEFSFLVPERELLVKIKTSIETVQYTIAVDMDEQHWDVLAEEMNSKFKHFEELPFFAQDADFKNQVLSLMSPGFENQKDGESNINDIMKYKDESTEFKKTAPCQRTLIELNKEEIQRSILNLGTKFSKIDPNWDVNDVKTDPLKISTIFSFITTYNIAFGEIERTTSEILSSLELMSDNKFPENLMRANKTCEFSNTVKETEGEMYEILGCHGSKTGYHCTTVVTQPMQLTKFIKLHAVNYNGWEISGPQEDWIFIKNPETEAVQYALCKDSVSAHPTCLTKELEAPCKLALAARAVSDTIAHCYFSENTQPDGFKQVMEGGVLIQQADSVSSGQTILSNVPPYIVYSPEILTIAREGEEAVLIPAIAVESLVIVTSSLTEKDIAELEWTHSGESFIESLDAEDYMNLVLALIQLILIPATVYCMCRMKNQKGTLDGLMTAVHGPDKRTIYKRNYTKVKGRDSARN